MLPKAGGQTSGQLRVALRRAVIAADPDGAEQRRRDAQRHAKVSLYPDPADGTATLAATRLPGSAGGGGDGAADRDRPGDEVRRAWPAAWTTCARSR